MPSVNMFRGLRSNYISGLSAISDTVTRTSEVPRSCWSIPFLCRTGWGLRQRRAVIQVHPAAHVPALPPLAREKFHLEQRTFVCWQRIGPQKKVAKTPTGPMPHTLDVILRNDNFEIAKAGDRFDDTGIPVTPTTLSACLALKTASTTC